MNENILKFLEKLSDDKELQDKFSTIKDPDEAYQLAHSIQDGFTKEELMDEIRSLKESMANEDLNPEDLNAVAGGISFSHISGAVAGASVVTLLFLAC